MLITENMTQVYLLETAVQKRGTSRAKNGISGTPYPVYISILPSPSITLASRQLTMTCTRVRLDIVPDLEKISPGGEWHSHLCNEAEADIR